MCRTVVSCSKNIKGIKINNVEYCIFQCVDDKHFTLDGSQRTLLELLNTINKFKTCSGLKMNMDKFTATWVGSKIVQIKDFADIYQYLDQKNHINILT